MKVISTDKAPAAIGPYSQAIQAGPFLFLSGQVPINPQTGAIDSEDIVWQTQMVVANIEAILEEAGYAKTDVIKSTCFLTDMTNFGAMNEVYEAFYGEHKPARSAVAVRELPRGASVEIETIAYKE